MVERSASSTNEAGQFLLQQLLAFSSVQNSDASRQRLARARESAVDGRAVIRARRLYLHKWIADRRAGGDTFSAIAASLNAQGIRGGHGARWYSSGVRRYLHRYADPALAAASPALAADLAGAGC